MTERITEILEHHYAPAELSKVARMFGSFPVGDPIRDYARGREQLEQEMERVTPLLCRADAVRALVPYMNGSHSEHVHTLADRIRAAATRQPPQPALATLGSGVGRRAIHGRPGLRQREAGSY
jgi:hypothetical protein